MLMGVSFANPTGPTLGDLSDCSAFGKGACSFPLGFRCVWFLCLSSCFRCLLGSLGFARALETFLAN